MVTKQEIVNQLKEIKYPGFDRDIISFGIISDIELGETTLKVNISLKSQDPKVASEIKSSVEKTLKKNNPNHIVIADISPEVTVTELTLAASAMNTRVLPAIFFAQTFV